MSHDKGSSVFRRQYGGQQVSNDGQSRLLLNDRRLRDDADKPQMTKQCRGEAADQIH